MLDVHPPHQSAHTWKDFFIHIATIVVGLVIAVGLEQAVETLHRAHERSVLLSELHEECVHNRDVTARNTTAYRNARRWGTDAVAALRNAQPSGGFITVTLPARSPDVHPYSPSRSVWTIAKANGTAALLSDNVAAIFDRIDHAAEEFELTSRENIDAIRDVEEFQLSLGVEIHPENTLHLSLAGRDELIRKLSHLVAQEHSCSKWNAFWGGESQAVLDGVTNREQLEPYVVRAAAESDKL